MGSDAQHDRQAVVPLASLSPEFLEGDAEAGLKKVLTRLIDLLNRNGLLNSYMFMSFITPRWLAPATKIRERCLCAG
jgi:hypothetical protein